MTNFGTDDYKYARILSPNRYEIVDPNRTITIPAGERSGIMPINFKLEGLSPDSTYFIPFKTENCSAYELNLDKSAVLYRVHFKNFWASTKNTTEYSHRGYRILKDAIWDKWIEDMEQWKEDMEEWEASHEPDEEAPARPVAPQRMPTYLNKRVVPVSRNEIRLYCGTKSYNASEDLQVAIVRYSLRITINDDGSLIIKPWDESHLGLNVEQVYDNIDPDDIYGNTYELIDDGFGKVFRTFRLCYDYEDPSSNTTPKEKYRMWEELRLEYIENANN